MSKSETINKSITKASQSVFYTELLKYKGHSLRISIKSNAYKDQCLATASIFSPDHLQWNTLWIIPEGGMETELSLHNHQDWDNPNHFTADRDTLITYMADIL
tara:strand:- start:1424 stop:1732 length:309 start_codon:yes stop_codon:yes gene_type:complete